MLQYNNEGRTNYEHWKSIKVLQEENGYESG